MPEEFFPPRTLDDDNFDVEGSQAAVSDADPASWPFDAAFPLSRTP